ncbi:MAG: sodium:solute symporter family protein [Planctomycetota bacterium]|jgi:Na+/proline symporter
MLLQPIDWVFIGGFFIVSLVVGVIVTKQAGRNTSEFFLSGRHMPWWLLGISMVATTFSTDTPNLVTDIVRQHGISGNWEWWPFLLTGMLTVFVYARLWRRSGVMTDVEFYELRYSGRPAAFLRGFRALYLGVFFNIVVMAAVTLAAIKIGRVLLNLSPFQTISIAAVVTVIYSMLGGLRGVLITDFFQFALAMVGSFMAAKVALGLPEIGGLANLLTNENVITKLNILPDFSNKDLLVTVFIIPLAVQWWSVYYPGSEPGGGGFLVQRMLAAKDEKNAVGATLLFTVAHYALRPWPWFIVALCSLVIFPDIASLKVAFPDVEADIVKHDLAYPAMLTFLKPGWLGLVITSLIAAYMSTMSTCLNWGSSYIVNDFYKRFMEPQANEKRLVIVGRVSTLLLMVIACLLALVMSSALQMFHIILQIGAGTGLIFILRWFWWRISAISEIVAMVVSFVVAMYFQFIHPHTGLGELAEWQKLVTGVGITTFAWFFATFVTRPTDEKTLRSFYRLINPGGPGWKAVLNRAKAENDPIGECDGKSDLPMGILCMFFGCVAVYSAVFATGYWIYGNYTPATILTITGVISTLVLIKTWGRLHAK